MKWFVVMNFTFNLFSIGLSISFSNIFNAKVDPDVDLTTLQMIRKAGYPAEGHVVATDDGYLLELHRIPGKQGSPTVFLQHGLLSSSADWIIPGKRKALAYILADRGYDVWLGNFRGNTYSKAHVNMSTSTSKFWDFSWHEMGVYDLPAMVSYVVNFKNDLLSAYIGHSMGTTAFYVMAIERPDVAKMVHLMISLAPVTFMGHVKTPLRFIAPIANDCEKILHFMGEDEFLPQNSFVKFLAKFGCDIDIWGEKICANALFVVAGFDTTQFNYTLLPTVLGHSPAGASTKTLIHYAQEIDSGHFRRYDYGTKRNMELYGSNEPPDYDLSKISLPIALFYSDNDWLSSSIDVIKFSKNIENKVDMYKVPYPKFNHIDYLWGIDAPELVYKRLVYVLQKYNRRNELTKSMKK